SDHHRAVLSTGAAEADGQVAFALMNVVGQQVDQQVGNAADELLGLRERSYIFGDLRIASGERPGLRYAMRIGEKAHIEHQVGIVGHSVFETEADTGDK